MQSPYLSVIIPAYNEEKRIANTLESVIKYLSGKEFTYEILVVNDGSEDNTAGVVTEISTKDSSICLLSNPLNLGKGAAVKTGMLAASGKFRLFMDADDSTEIGHFDLMVPLLEKGTGVVIGSRRIEGAVIEIHQNWIRENLGRLFNLLVRFITGLPYNDTQAGFKAFSSVAADSIFKELKISGWAFDIEILVIARKRAIEIREIPLTWKNSPVSHVKFSGMIKMLIDVIRIKYNFK